MFFPKTYINFKTFFFYLFFFSLFLPLSFSDCYSQLNGNYSIGPGGYFPDLNSAVNELTKNGVSGKVNFEIQNGVYVEQIIIPHIKGTSYVNKIIFQSLSGNRDDVEIKYSGTAEKNYVINLEGCGFVEFKNLTLKNLNKSFPGLLKFSDYSNNVRIYGLKLESPKFPVTDYNTAIVFNGTLIENIILEDILFLNSFVAVKNIQNNSDITNLTLYENEFFNCYYSINLNNINGLTIESNYFENIYDGIKLIHIHGISKINKNKFYKSVNTGICIADSKFIDSFMLNISNNSYSGNGVGLKIDSGCININVAYNTIAIKENKLFSNYYSSSLEIFNCDKIKIINNIFTNFSDGFVFNFKNISSENHIDFNNFFTTGVILAIVDDKPIGDLSNIEKIYKSNLNSFSENPLFESDKNLLPLSEKLKIKSSVNFSGPEFEDVNGVRRNSLSGIGAYHYQVLQSSEKLNSKICFNWDYISLNEFS